MTVEQIGGDVTGIVAPITPEQEIVVSVQSKGCLLSAAGVFVNTCMNWRSILRAITPDFSGDFVASEGDYRKWEEAQRNSGI